MTTPTPTTLTDTAADAIERARSGAEDLADEAVHLTDRAASAMRESTRKLREETVHLAESTVGYIKDEPVKAVLIAAAAGAALMALATLASRSVGSRD